MKRLSKAVLSTVMVALLAPSASAQVDDKPANWHTKEGCGAGVDGAFVLLTVRDVRLNEGLIRVQTYDNDPDNFLEKGKRLMRMVVDINYDEDKGQDVCVPLPSAGNYAIYVLHDQNGNKKTDFFTDGFGFSSNPKMSLAKPDHEDVVMNFKDGLQFIDINMNYVIGEDAEDKKRRRRSKRR